MLQVRYNPTLAWDFLFQMSHITRKPVFGICDLVRLKPACSAKETSYSPEILGLASIGIILQATPAMSTSHISILPLMSKWFFIPNIFSLHFFAFQLRLCRKRLTWSNGYLEVIFCALDVFSIIIVTVYVEVLNRRSHGRHIVCCISWGANVFQTTIKIN